MDWRDEHWVKLYRRDTTDWLALSLGARGLFCLLLRVVNRAGVLDLGKTGPRAVAVHLHGSWAEVEPLLAELTTDGCVRIVGNALVIPNFLAAQEAPQSDKARASESRARRRDAILGVSVTNRDGADTIRDTSVTPGHAPSRAVTPSHEEKRREETDERESRAPAPAPSPAPAPAPAPSPAPAPATETADALPSVLSRASGGACSSVATLEQSITLATMLADLGVVGGDVERFGASLASGGLKRAAPWLKTGRTTVGALVARQGALLADLVVAWRAQSEPASASPKRDLEAEFRAARAAARAREEAARAAGGERS